MITPYVLVVLNIIAVVTCYQIAKSRGGNARFWGGLAVFFGPFAIPFAFFAEQKPTLKPESTKPNLPYPTLGFTALR